MVEIKSDFDVVGIITCINNLALIRNIDFSQIWKAFKPTIIESFNEIEANLVVILCSAICIERDKMLAKDLPVKQILSLL